MSLTIIGSDVNDLLIYMSLAVTVYNYIRFKHIFDSAITITIMKFLNYTRFIKVHLLSTKHLLNKVIPPSRSKLTHYETLRSVVGRFGDNTLFTFCYKLWHVIKVTGCTIY